MQSLTEWLRSPEGVRLATFLGVLAATALAEAVWPRRARALARRARWPANLALVALNTMAVRFVLPVSAVLLAGRATERGWGLLALVEWPAAVEWLLAIVALDLAIYLQHVLFHAVPALWRLHRVHHADLDFDVTTGLRFHTLEIVLSMGIKLGVVAALGPAAWAVVLFETLLSATALFNHANLRLPPGVDRLLRLLVVTPDMHRVHHSVDPAEMNRNFGFNLPWWDYLLGTYRAAPAAGHAGMTLGLAECREPRETNRLPGMLAMPWRGSAADSGDRAR